MKVNKLLIGIVRGFSNNLKEVKERVLILNKIIRVLLNENKISSLILIIYKNYMSEKNKWKVKCKIEIKVNE